MNNVISSSVHIKAKNSTRDIMLDVILSLIPAAAWGVFLFGINALSVILVSVATAVLSEHLWCLLLKKQSTAGDLSAALTGLLLALSLPPAMPVWMVMSGSMFAIIIVKQFFGGLGKNIVNPAITARVVILVSFPSALTKYTVPFTDTVASATPIAEAGNGTLDFSKLFFGNHSGSIGETSALLLLAGGIYLAVRKVISPTIPLSFICSAFVTALIIGVNPVAAVLTGGILLGAVFMATDYVTSPTPFLGKVVFGVGCGVITMLIRGFGNMPEGVSFAILFMNMLTPYLDKLKIKSLFLKKR